MSVGQNNQHEASLKKYIIGFVSSIILTLDSYFVVTKHLMIGWGLVAIIAAFALIQLVIQLIFFLHLSPTAKPRWKIAVFWYMLMVVGIVVLGSVWIMRNLDYHHEKLTPYELENFITQDEGIKK